MDSVTVDNAQLAFGTTGEVAPPRPDAVLAPDGGVNLLALPAMAR
jgi:hypothetical protein